MSVSRMSSSTVKIIAFCQCVSFNNGDFSFLVLWIKKFFIWATVEDVIKKDYLHP